MLCSDMKHSSMMRLTVYSTWWSTECKRMRSCEIMLETQKEPPLASPLSDYICKKRFLWLDWRRSWTLQYTAFWEVSLPMRPSIRCKDKKKILNQQVFGRFLFATTKERYWKSKKKNPQIVRFQGKPLYKMRIHKSDIHSWKMFSASPTMLQR